MRRPVRGQSEDDREADDPTLIRVPRPDEDASDDPDDAEDSKDEEHDGRADEDPAEDSDRG